ncbi:hypothetical protein GCM10011316_27270 [Roseibium aquae]|uniref:Uncharacterized protein n=2 Tax=Roseibium aquae TaxID=1323746 RepID=A0A916X2J0_9HYPH|nr:hypothetical protein GCM10011316_27270 [Roseibium aquae]
MFLSGLGTTYFMADSPFDADRGALVGGLDYETLQPINVPMIADGALQGYVVAKLVFTADGDKLRRLPVPPHPFLVDEAFRTLYEDDTLDFKNLERYDLDRLTGHLAEMTNKRLGEAVVREVLVEEFNYFHKDAVISY